MTNHFTQSQIQEYHEVFGLLDKDGDGSFNTKELGAVMRSLGLNPTEAELQDMIGEVDVDGDGEVDFEEFLLIMSDKLQGGGIGQEDELRDAFNVFVQKGETSVSAERLHQLMTSLGERLGLEEIRDMIAAADVNEDGMVDYQDFVKVLMSTEEHAPQNDDRLQADTGN